MTFAPSSLAMSRVNVKLNNTTTLPRLNDKKNWNIKVQLRRTVKRLFTCITWCNMSPAQNWAYQMLFLKWNLLVFILLTIVLKDVFWKLLDSSATNIIEVNFYWFCGLILATPVSFIFGISVDEAFLRTTRASKCCQPTLTLMKRPSLTVFV